MHLSDFDYSLPADLIAQNPIEPRDQARLLVYTKFTRQIEDYVVADLPRLLPQKTMVVVNNSKVRKSRFVIANLDRESTKQRELLLIKYLDGDDNSVRFECVLSGKNNIDERIEIVGVDFGGNPVRGLIESIIPNEQMQTYIIRFDLKHNDFESFTQEYGKTPLPPYIHHSTAPDSRYQTVYAQEIGSAAAPTAGLHFTPQLISNLKRNGFEWEEIILHVGLGTFAPLRKENIEENELHYEKTDVSEEAASHINNFKRGGGNILSVGTTSVRTLESHWDSRRGLRVGNRETNLFIKPGYRFGCVDMIMTNFHLPKSSLLLLVAAFIADQEKALDYEEALGELNRIYQYAIQEKYRFYSFGDAMLILP